MTDQLSVSKNGVKRIKLSQFEKHYLNEETKDITFIIGGQRIPAHKIILSSRSDVFYAMLYGKFKESNDKEIELKDTSMETFKLFLKFIYFDEFNSDDFKDYLMAIEVFKLSHRFEIKPLSDMIEEELINKITFDNLLIVLEFAVFYKMQKLLDAYKDFIKQNEKQIIGNIEKVLIREPIETAVKFLNLLKLSQTQLITALNNIHDRNADKDLTKYRVIIKFELCSIKDLNALRNICLFEAKDLDKVIEKKYEDLELRYLGMNAEFEKLRGECETHNTKYAELSKRYVDINSKYIELMSNYKEVKDVFAPFVEGVGGRVNQYVYNKTNCYLGKDNKKFQFKF